jgi:hypothetical protein
MKRSAEFSKEKPEKKDKKPRNRDIIPNSVSIHINSIPFEILGIIMNECEEYSFVSQFICKHWKETYKYLIQPEWNKEIQKREGKKTRITLFDKISLSFLKWVVNDVKGKDNITRRSMNRAAFIGDLEMIKWLKKQGCPWDEWTCTWSIKGGHKEILKYLIEQRCPCHMLSFLISAEMGDSETLKWLKEHEIW